MFLIRRKNQLQKMKKESLKHLIKNHQDHLKNQNLQKMVKTIKTQLI